ncbi:GGDEF domain-containing protein [Rheinheimera sp. NSM]|uniref:GGDEF domain-containing protein n=1 Tax=Rheinheimera sp. NSM TaxID=3457884 RepID=UPI0040359793
MEYALLHDVALSSAPCYAAITKLQHWPELPASAEQSLISQLQTTLDIQQQVNIVSMAVGKILPLSLLQLNTAVGEFPARGSQTATFEHRSMLVLNQQCLAELVYQSDYAFTPMLQRELLLLESEWLFSLRNALVVARLQQLALKDTLTGLGNRRFFDDAIAKAVQLAQRNDNSCALLLLDLDNFKQVNDVAGHAAGDEVLLVVAGCLRDTLRATDSIFRFGGDEFAVILSGQDADSAQLVARRLLKVINQHHLCQQYNVSASAGLAQLKPGQDVGRLFKAADDALYDAKNAGKSTVRFA